MIAKDYKLINPTQKINSIQFGLLSPDEIRKIAVAQVKTPDTYDDDGFPITMGLMDPHLGVIEPGLRCKTCGARAGECPGHFGRIELAMPVTHVGYARTIRDILRATCRNCSRVTLSQDKIDDFTGRISGILSEGLDAIPHINEALKAAADVKDCPHCGEDKKTIELEKPTTFREGGFKFNPSEIRERLERIRDEDLFVIGFNPEYARPEWMVLTVLPVPPVTIRPSITLESSERSEDDLTHKLVDIIRINQRLQENRDAGAPQLIIEDLWELLQYHVTTYFDNAAAGVPPARHRSGRPLKTLTERLEGKEGRFRFNLAGKRVNFSARTVVSPDAHLSINEVGVPLEIAMEMTIPVKVTQFNIELLKEIVRNGPKKHPGANYVIRTDGRRWRITDKNTEDISEKLEVGYVVERHLSDRDIIIFNRQPSLHRMSIMAHYVRVMPYKTFRLNLSVCPPYNADFDGDEMNMHVLQGEEARAEAKNLMLVEDNIISPRFGGPIIGALHDHISGAYLMTRHDTKFNKEETLSILAAINYNDPLPKPAITENGVKYWTGKQIMSTVFPKDLSVQFRAEICRHCRECKKEECETDAYVVVKNGQIIRGTIDEKAIGAFKGIILNKVIRDYGNEKGRMFLDDLTRLCISSIMVRSFTTGIGDEDIPQEAKAEIHELMTTARKKVDEFIQAYDRGELEPLPGRSLKETLEMEIMQLLGRARDSAGRVAERHLGMENSAVIMAVSGARGSMLNLTQMAACVGQQAVRGERINRGYKNRTLPHYKEGEIGAEAKGFVESSYKSGLNPLEYFFHSMGGREGLVDTAVRTSRSGYMQRRLVNALVDLKVELDGTVRDAKNAIVQFAYGEDGIDSSKSNYGDAVNLDEIVDNVLKGGE